MKKYIVYALLMIGTVTSYAANAADESATSFDQTIQARLYEMKDVLDELCAPAQTTNPTPQTVNAASTAFNEKYASIAEVYQNVCKPLIENSGPQEVVSNIIAHINQTQKYVDNCRLHLQGDCRRMQYTQSIFTTATSKTSNNINDLLEELKKLKKLT